VRLTDFPWGRGIHAFSTLAIVDINGAMNTLTSLHPSPLAKGNAVHTTIANVEKA
jgi:anaerobic selenocysteine-containing dehydrogenase